MNGGNLHAPSSFSQVDISAYTKGVYPSYGFLLDKNNFACLGLFQAVFDDDVWLSKMYANDSLAVGVVNEQVKLFQHLKCPNALGPFDAGLFD
jgi:hypothetical protein